MASRLSLVSPEPQHQKRFQLLGENLQAETQTYANDETASENEKDLAASQLVFVSGTDLTKDSDLAGRVQVVKYAAPESWIVVIADKKLKTESAAFLKKSGAYSVLLEDEFLSSIKPEFICSQKLHGEWIPIKSSELKIGSTVPMALYHFLPLNRKFLPFLTAGSVIDEARAQKAAKVGEVFFKRDDVLLYHQYIKANEDKTAAGLTSRCRQQYLAMNLVFKDLVLLLTDQSEGASFQKGKELMEFCRKLADDFVTSLSAVGEAWQIVNNTGFDDLTPIDRAPAIAATASLMSLLSGIGNATDIFLASILADVGLLDLSPKALNYWKQGKIDQLPDEEAALYKNHPVQSINRILSRKIPIDDGLREVIQNTHERIDMKGFPNRPFPEKIPAEAQLIQLAEMMDQELKVDFGKERRDPQEGRKKVLEREKESGKALPFGLLGQIEKAL